MFYMGNQQPIVMSSDVKFSKENIKSNFVSLGTALCRVRGLSGSQKLEECYQAHV